MNNANRETLAAVFAKPSPKNLRFSAIEALLEAVGCRKLEGAGSRVRFVKGDAVITFHRPHPGKEAKPYQVKDARRYLLHLGVILEKQEG